jgi:hypothetical protein
MAKISGIPVDFLLTINFMYEFSAHCTSMVVQNDKNEMIFARNLDFDFSYWLSALSVEGHFYKGEQLIYKGNMIVGYTGILTGIKPGIFALSVDERDSHSTIIENVEEMLFRNSYDDIIWARRVLERATTYEEALEMLMD